jgi:hypothetical protein
MEGLEDNLTDVEIDDGTGDTDAQPSEVSDAQVQEQETAMASVGEGNPYESLAQAPMDEEPV